VRAAVAAQVAALQACCTAAAQPQPAAGPGQEAEGPSLSPTPNEHIALVLHPAAWFFPRLFQIMPLLAMNLVVRPACLQDEVRSFCWSP
jgi:hypothetical protein